MTPTRIALAVALVTAAAVVPRVGAAPSDAWTPPPPTYLFHDASHAQVMQILPAGENGLVNLAQAEAFEQNGTRPPNSSDQQAPYFDLLYHQRGLTDADLSKYFFPETFGIPSGQLSRTETPSSSENVVIYRDRQDVPHIYGDSLTSMAYGAGYAAAEDRLFLMDVLRHYGEGQLAAFLGPSCSFEQMDHDQLLATGYTTAQAQAQLDALPREYGTLGTQTEQMIGSYVQGVNAYITATQFDPNLLPADYAAAVGPPQPWVATDVVAVISLIGSVATGGGHEVAAAGLDEYLKHRLGSSAGTRAFATFKSDNDRGAPTTIHDRRFDYPKLGRIDHAVTALPDHASKPLTGGPADTTSGCDLGSGTPAIGAISSLLRSDAGDSNALLVTAKHSTSGHPLAVFGPELGYYAPQILMEEDLHAPGYEAAGATFPGASFVVTIGRGRNFAWSATTASTDQIDQRVERLCNPAGGAVAAQQTDYLFRGRCLAMATHTFTETAYPKPGGMGAPTVISHTLYYTRHGVVQGWTTVRGKPVAVADERSTRNHEPDSLVGFVRWGEPSLTHSAKTWMRGATDIAYAFNWLYVDTQHIAYYVSGRDPIRNPHADPDLPTWGTGQAEWRGLLSFRGHPHEVDPPQGYFTSWNNKPAPGFTASDDMYGWSLAHRSQLLDTALHRQLKAHHGRVTRADLVSAMEQAATQDLSGFAVIPALRRWLRSGGPVRDHHAALLLAVVEPWASGGAHRQKLGPKATQYADADAIAIWDEAYPLVVKALFDPLLTGGGVTHVDGMADSYDVLPMRFANTPNALGAHQGDGYYVGWEGYLVKAFDTLAGRPAGTPMAHRLFSSLCGAPARCRARVLHAMDVAFDRLASANHTRYVSPWNKDTASVAAGVTMPEYDDIEFQAVGIVGQPIEAWVNRPTYQQVATFP
jgi:acyl-homoserine lactone acylase PvdQ